MILPVKYLWEQLDGPQIRAISNALFEYMRQQFDAKLDYLNTLNIDVANDSHLTLLGILANFVRPVIIVPDKEFFFLTEYVDSGSERGFASLDNRARGGRLVEVTGATTEARALNTEYYRELLRAFIQGEGEIGSLVLLDDICYSLAKLDQPLQPPSYVFSFMEGDNIPQGRAPGDIYIDIGSLDDWVNPMQIYAVLRGLAQSSYAPTPQLFISIDAVITVPTPTSSLPSGAYGGEQTVYLSCALSSANIYYTTDGTEPSSGARVYNPAHPLSITKSTMLRVKAIAAGYNSSPVVDFNYIIQ